MSRITGLDKLQRDLEQATKAFETLDGKFAELRLNPLDQTSVEAAITDMGLAVDAKIASYLGNPLVESVAGELKARYENEILERVAEVRLKTGEGGMSAKAVDQNILRQIENTVSDLRRSDFNTFGRHVKKLSRLLHSESLDAISRALTEKVDLPAWIAAGEVTQGSMVGSAELEWPSSTEEELGLVVALIDRFSEIPDEASNFSYKFYYNSNDITRNIQNMIAQMIVPFARGYIDYVKASTGSTEATLLPIRSEPAARKIFIVHGHDEGPREAVARFLERLDFEPIILHEQPNQGRTIIEKIEAHGDVGFAIVLLTPDDIGAAKGQNTQPRPRQNVLLELGYFIGRLGRSRVCALKRGDMEVPSDFEGIVYEPFDAGGGWKSALGRELKSAGFDIDWNVVMN